MVCIILALLAFGDNNADAAQPQSDSQFDAPADHAVWQTVSERTLDRMRGGFDAGGLMVSFGITRAVYLNGALLTETTLNLGQLAQLSPAQASQLGSQIAGLDIVKIGPGNTATLQGTGVAGALPGVIVQNTLNNQNLAVQTMINATSNGLGLLRGINSSRTLLDASR
ncbi:hypothetical protein RD110_16895 [Rhodoferax koreense]|uniref:Uncharacterized protein n=2 Tax=Rhodoferax koreensis TaxID=1842727 RepID=A0A1P8JYB2_9BURK|nr:hypothetical protein RD110_16895 [Rhodoferax koreense]